MKILICSLAAQCLMGSFALAEDEKPIEAKLISTTISHGLPEGTPTVNRPYNYKDGATLVYYFEAENIVSFDKDSFFVAGWDKEFQSTISYKGKSASITITNKKFKGIIEEIEADGRIDVQLGIKKVTKNLVLKKDAEPTEFPHFTIELLLEEDENNKFRRPGVKVVGKHKMIHRICIIRDGKEITSRGSSSSSSYKTFVFEDIKDGDEIQFIYWSEIKSKSVKLYK